MARHTNSSRRLAKQLTDLGVAAPMVIATRVSRMMFAGPSPSANDQREMHTMVSEKMAATQDAALAMASSALRMQQEFAAAAMQAWLKPWTGAATNPMWWLERATTIAADGMAPFRAKAVGNARRLRTGGRP